MANLGVPINGDSADVALRFSRAPTLRTTQGSPSDHRRQKVPLPISTAFSPIIDTTLAGTYHFLTTTNSDMRHATSGLSHEAKTEFIVPCAPSSTASTTP